MTDNKYENSAPLDVHRWSEYSEVNQFVDEIHSEHFADYHKDIMKKHLKVVLLDLYVRWCEDPTMYIAVSMTKSGYKAKSRYNALNISSKTIDVIHRLWKQELITFKKGFHDPKGKSFITRIRASDALIELFKEVKFSIYHIGNPEGRETIILRSENKEDIEYDDTADTRRMRDHLESYNDLLWRTFIDIPEVATPIIDVGKGKKTKHVRITPHDKFVRRVFNNGNWKQGGRFYGGWWQRIPSAWRGKITLNGNPTIEDDYSSLHIALLYAREGIDFYADYKEDPYSLNIKEIDDPEESRNLVKLLFLTAINAKDEKATFGAVREHYRKDYHEFMRLTNDRLKEILNQLKELHPKIAKMLCSGAGIDLMNIDGKISEYVVNTFKERQIPVLCIHDSYIVPFKEEETLNAVMDEAIARVTETIKFPRIDKKGISYKQLINQGRMDNDPYHSYQKFRSVTDKEKTEEYEIRYRDHLAFFGDP